MRRPGARAKKGAAKKGAAKKGAAKKTGAKRKPAKRAQAMPVEYSLLLTVTLCLLAFGVVMVFSASSTTSLLGETGDGAYYLKRTLIFGALGLLAMRVLRRRRGADPAAADRCARGGVLRPPACRPPAGHRRHRQRCAALDRRRAASDPALRDREAGVDPLRGQPARDAAEDRREPADADAVSGPGRARLGPDRGRARPRHGDRAHGLGRGVAARAPASRCGCWRSVAPRLPASPSSRS